MEIPGYQIQRELGRGGMAAVYLAVQASLLRPVALKVMSPALAVDPSFQERFLKEGRIVAALTHPNIVTVFDLGSYADRYYLSMEYLPGGTLRQALHDGLPQERCLDIIARVAEALGYAHARGIVHRDIKSANILFQANGNPMVTDFGIAKALDASTVLTVSGLLVGSPTYMSPEQVRGQPVDARSDLYSLGVLFHELLTGRLPFQATDPFAMAFQHLHEPIPRLPADQARFQPLLNRLMAKNPIDRYPNAETFLEALERFRAAPNIPPPVARAAVSGRWPLLAAAILPLVGALVYWWPESGSTGDSTVRLTPAPAPEPTLATAPPPRSQTRSESAPAPKPLPVLQTEPDPVTGLLEAAGRRLDRGVLIEPKNDSALDLLRRVLELDPDNHQAAAGLERIARHYRQQAERHAAVEEPEQALAQLDIALKVLPDNRDLMELRTRLEVQRRQAVEARERADAVAALLAQAQGQLQRLRLTLPPGDNAYETYRQVLDMDPDNPAARLGLARVAASYRQLAESRRNQGDPQGGLVYVERGLEVDPGARELLDLRTTLRVQAAEQERLRREQESEAARQRKEQADREWGIFNYPL